MAVDCSSPHSAYRRCQLQSSGALYEVVRSNRGSVQGAARAKSSSNTTFGDDSAQ